MALRLKLPLDDEIPDELSRFWEEQAEPYLKKTSQIRAAFPVADTPTRFRHRLPERPEGFTVVDIDGPGRVYRIREDIRKTDKFHAWLRCDVAGVEAVVEFF